MPPKFNYTAEGPKGCLAAYLIMTWCSVPENWAAFLNYKKDPDLKKKGQNKTAAIQDLMVKLEDGGFTGRKPQDIRDKINKWYDQFKQMKQKMEETGEGIDDEDLKKGKQKTVHGTSSSSINCLRPIHLK
jgi:hypothetical protein